MALVSMTEMLNEAAAGGYAVGQFNLNNLEFTQAILQAAEEEGSPVILGVSEAYIPYMGGLPCIAGMVNALIDHYGIMVPVALHLDHGSTYEVCVRALKAGFTSVMIDASHHPLEENIVITRKVTEAAHVLGASVKAELGRRGTAKINVNTDNQMSCTAAIRAYLEEHPAAYDPRSYLGPAREAVKAAVKEKMRLFGSTHKAG